MNDLKYRIDAAKKQNPNFLENGIKALELINLLYSQYLAADVHEKAVILKKLASNYTLNDATPCPTYRRPFSIFAKGPSCPTWLPILDALRTPDRQEVILRVKLYKRRKRGILLSLGEPFPDNYHPRKPAQYKNFVLEALQVKAFMAAHPEETYLSAAPKLNLDRKRVAKLLKIANNLPGNLITELSNCNDPKTLQRMKFNRLLRLASQRTLKSDSPAPLASA